MKLLLVSVKSDTVHGGIAVWTERFLTRCAQLNIECDLVNTELIGTRVRTGRRRIWDEVIRTLRIYRQLKKLLKAERFDAAYLNTSCGSFGLFRDAQIGRIISKHKIPLVTQYHCEIPHWVHSKASRWCLGRLAAMSEQNLVLCRKSEAFLREQYGQDPINVPNFVDMSTVLTEDKHIAPKITNICFVGRVSEKKGAAELFAVAQQLPESTFTLIGHVSNGVLAWEKPANVLLLGSMSNDQVIKQLDQADVFLFPSHTEGCSMALMEAMARGLPCVATDVGANRDMLGGKCGVIVPKHDVDAMLTAIRSLEDPKRREEMSRQAVETVKESYTERNVDKIISMINNI